MDISNIPEVLLTPPVLQKPRRASRHAMRRYRERVDQSATVWRVLQAALDDPRAVWVEKEKCVLLVTFLSV